MSAYHHASSNHLYKYVGNTFASGNNCIPGTFGSTYTSGYQSKNNGTKFGIYMVTNESSKCLSMSEAEHMSIASTLDTLFDRCVRTCDNSDFASTVGAITDYMEAYKRSYSRFFEEPVEVSSNQPAGKGSPQPTDDTASEQTNRYSASKKALSFDYSDENIPAQDGDRRRWHVAAKARVPRDVCSLILYHRKRCVGIMGRMMQKVSTLDDLKTVTRVSREASRLGMDVLKGMYEAMSMINAKMGRTDRALEYIERMWSHGERRRYRTYEPLLTNFEEHWNGEGILRVLRHMVEKAKLPVSGLLFTRVAVIICLSTRHQLVSTSSTTGGTQTQGSETTSISETSPLDNMDPDVMETALGNPEPMMDPHSAMSSPGTTTLEQSKITQVYKTLGRQLHELLEIYRQHACNRIALSSRLGYVIYSIFSRTFPNVVKFTHVSPCTSSESHLAADDHTTSGNDLQRNISYGNCASCNYQLPLVDLPQSERLSVFRKWLQHIYDYNYPEIIRIANFYTWLHAPMVDGKGYTCVLDGQNIGYHQRESMSPLNFHKIELVLQEMLQRGERPFIVLPYYARTQRTCHLSDDTLHLETLQLLFPGSTMPPQLASIQSRTEPSRLKRYDANKIALIDKWYTLRQAYFCASESYDDNYFFLANVMSGSAEELHVLAGFVKSSLELLLLQAGHKDLEESGTFLPDPKVEDYLPTVGRPPPRPVMMTVTNDTLGNLDIPGVDEHSMRILRDIPLTPYFFADSSSKGRNATSGSSAAQRPVVGQRLRYSLETRASDNGRYHIPLGYERKVIDYRARHTVSVSSRESPCIEPPLSGAYLDTVGHTDDMKDHNNDQELKQVNSWLDKYGYAELLHGLGEGPTDSGSRRRFARRFQISTKTPEIIKQKFNPSQQTRWLCVDISSLGDVGV
ncbi:ankyrin repeat-containing protein, putative [Babesia ovis]|uniref:Ankyrin repeat-containing protein, putative n=1 Tax=Babesia ovis TaxID=5869 RepID=A0A9W5WVI4_BABOV|nr:ankyrin repeat-containing protein, putative [Babesia ovis]